MRALHAPYLLDPVGHAPLTLTPFRQDNSHVIAGILANEEHWYPIIGGVPRLLIGELRANLLREHHAFFREWQTELPDTARREWQGTIEAIKDFDTFLEHQRKTGESFAYEWKHIYRENDFEEQNFFHFLSPFVKKSDLVGKRTLDIGCGSGRFTKWAALSGTAISFGTDLSESVEVAYALTRDIENTCIVQADIYAMPFKNQFDLAYSIGVLHHLPQPEVGFAKLPSTLKPGGEMVIWVYNRRHNWRALYFYEPLRALFRHFPKPLLFKLCYLPGGIVHGINLFGRWLSTIGFPALEPKLPFAYYRHFPFNMKLNDAFDVLATPKSNYYYVEEIQDWFAKAKLTGIKAYEHPEAGITCIGTR